MDLDRSWARPLFRFAAWLALAYLVFVGGAIAIANLFLRIVPCRQGQGIELSCPVLGVDLYSAFISASTAGYLGLIALPVVVIVIAIMLLLGVCERASARSKARARHAINGKP